MSISTLSELEVKVIRDLRKRPQTNLVLDALRSAWRELLFESEVWREDLDPIDAVAEQATYTLTQSAGEIKRIIKVELNGTAVYEQGYYLDGTNTLTFEENFIPSEDITDGIEVELALNPEIDQEDGPAWVLNRFSAGIVAGAQMELCRMRERAWYDPDMYLIKKSDFQTAIGKAVVARSQKRTTRKTGFVGGTRYATYYPTRY